MAQTMSKEEHLTVSNLMEREHWCTLIEEWGVPTVPLWRAFMRNLRFWKRLVCRTLCSTSRKAVAQWDHLAKGLSLALRGQEKATVLWTHLSAELSMAHRVRLFWLCFERSDVASEDSVPPRRLPYFAQPLVPRRISPPVRRRQHTQHDHLQPLGVIMTCCPAFL